MQYDPIKRSLGKVFNLHPLLRALFYRLLDLLLLRSWYLRRELRQWRLSAPDDARILDAGSGFGQYVWRLAQMGSDFQITGVDVKKEQVADCNAWFARAGLAARVHFRVQELEVLHDEERYDLVLSVDVMEHIEADEKVMQNLCRALKPGGLLLISTPTVLSGTKGGADMHDGLRINGVKHGRQYVEKPDLVANDVDYYSGSNEKPQVLEQRAFVKAIRGEAKPVVLPEEALIVTQILDAIYESSKTGKPVYFNASESKEV